MYIVGLIITFVIGEFAGFVMAALLTANKNV
ncbi:MAG: hypothetical protein K0R69_162 [Clostridia bacterium]|jgi:hypothetical protein|nr:hypothetical protein [Clostridia bacterium]